MLGAGWRSLFLIRLFPLTEKELLSHPTVNHIPWQDLVKSKAARSIKGRVNTRALEYVLGNSLGASPLNITPFDFMLALSERLSGDPSAFSQAAMYEQLCLTAYALCENEEQKNAVKTALLADFTANERTRIPSLLR